MRKLEMLNSLDDQANLASVQLTTDHSTSKAEFLTKKCDGSAFPLRRDCALMGDGRGMGRGRRRGRGFVEIMGPVFYRDTWRCVCHMILVQNIIFTFSSCSQPFKLSLVRSIFFPSERSVLSYINTLPTNLYFQHHATVVVTAAAIFEGDFSPVFRCFVDKALQINYFSRLCELGNFSQPPSHDYQIWKPKSCKYLFFNALTSLLLILDFLKVCILHVRQNENDTHVTEADIEEFEANYRGSDYEKNFFSSRLFCSMLCSDPKLDSHQFKNILDEAITLSEVILDVSMVLSLDVEKEIFCFHVKSNSFPFMCEINNIEVSRFMYRL
ncbi:hypothetical protein RHMOL_Rhmol12G0125600 [Rhododendron molle]|uniref:Uncharacterized protein n=1 Tax=Rhododendron molle TaxID=49168 RepID=A0ACC0LIC6_RHOML|nr:hypothetical protein RHMOL_Rhmol12G0125600 [Rhododendron molle]